MSSTANKKTIPYTAVKNDQAFYIFNCNAGENQSIGKTNGREQEAERNYTSMTSPDTFTNLKFSNIYVVYQKSAFFFKFQTSKKDSLRRKRITRCHSKLKVKRRRSNSDNHHAHMIAKAHSRYNCPT